MYISKVHLQGFKSFLNKTDLTFGRGITCVVGPNGCGKTNIVDSIRWILGEQKSSVLRSNKMEDVIFNGSHKRKPVSYCEASLMLHNEGRLPVEYTDIEITRRLFRSGESEYLMNKVPCRLKDINNLFMDTGMGSGAYSVIELKMIETILSQNASDRKHLIDEAAGINQYKQQRHQTHRKLELTRVDLNRVNDILIELEKNVNSLARQLKKYDRHEKMMSDLKQKSFLLASSQYQMLTSEINPIIDSIKNKRTTYTNLSSQMSIDEDLEKKIQLRYDNARSKLNDLNNNLKDISKNILEKNQNIIIWTENIKSNEGRIHQNNDEAKQIETQQKSLSSQLNDMKKELSVVIPEIVSRRKIFEKEKLIFQKLKQENEIEINKYKSKQAEFDDHLKFIYQKETEFKLNENSLDSKLNSLKNLKIRASELKIRKSKIIDEITHFKKNISIIEKFLKNLLIKVNDVKRKQYELNEKLEKTNHNIFELKQKNDQLNSKINLFKSILKSRGDQESGLIFIEKNKSNYSGIIGILSDLIEIPEEFHRASEAVMGELKNAVIVNKISTGKKILDDLKKNDGGALTIISLDMVRPIAIKKKNQFLKLIKYNKSISNLINHIYGHVKIVDTLSNILENSDYLVTKSGDILKNGYQLRGSSIKNKLSVLGKKKNIDLMIKERKKNQVKIEKFTLDSKKIEKKCDKIKLEISKLEEEIEIKISQKQKLEIKLSSCEASQNHIIEIKKENEKESHNLNIIVNSLKVSLDKNIKKVKELVNVKNDLKKVIEEISKKVENYRKKTNIQQEISQKKQLNLLEYEKEKTSIELRISSFNTRIEENKRRRERITDINEQLRNKNNDLSKKLNLEKELKLNIINEQEKLSDIKSTLESKYNHAYQQLKELQQNMRSHHKLKEERIFDIQKMELKLSSLKNDRKNIVDNIYQKFAITVEELKNFENKNINTEELISEIKSLERSIDRIGPINMAIKEEHERENERLIFIKNQVNDLVESEKKLIQTIRRIDDEARTKFTETFNQIKKNFKITFRRFFDGGEGDIKIDEEFDPLEADIEIIAKPPGKRTQSLKMLSAGEKALTAISLLFAIYLVKPSPFCILDEVDAPLDDRNIKKYTKVLREFAQNTQFIIVTHNKLTMESADYLYGVTQEEEGVSKLVSVKLKNNSQFNF